jgi:hypothetical protein
MFAHGTFCWNELVTPDRDAAARFFGALLGWRRDDQDMPTGPYTVFRQGEQMVAGMMDLSQMPEGVPPHWMSYIAVDDVDAVAARVQDLGGQVHVPPTDIPTVGRFCVIAEPGGAVVSLITMAPEA